MPGPEVLMSDGAIKRQGDSLAPQGVVCSVSRSAQYNPSGQPGWIKLSFDLEDFDPFGWFDSTTNFRFQPKIAGYYDISAGVQFGWPPTAGQTNIMGLYKNGVEYRLFGTQITVNSTNQVSSGSAVVYLNGTTDYVEVYGYFPTATQAVAPGSGTFLTASLVGSSVGVIPEPWHIVGASGEPAFQNSWVARTSEGQPTPAFYKDPNSVVRLRGTIQTGTNAAIFTLPVGYRPSGLLSVVGKFWNGTTAGACTYTITSGGVLAPDSNYTSTQMVIDGITFRAEQ